MASGDYIGYSKVVKTEKDAQNNINSSIERNYSNIPDFHYFFQEGVIPINMPSTKSPNSTENGKVLSEVVYDSSMNKIQQTDNTYSEVYSNVYYGTSLSRNSRSVWNFVSVNSSLIPQQHGVTVLGYYPIFSKESLLTQSIKKEYLNNKIFTTQTSFGYNTYNNLKEESTTLPNGEVDRVYLSYALDLYQLNLYNANMHSIPLQKVIYRNQDYSAFRTKYDDTSHLNPTSVQETSQVQPPNYIAEAKTVINYTLYDNKGNLLEYTDGQNIPTTIVWGYNQTLPIAKIVGAFYSSISQFLQDIINKSNLDTDTTSEQTLIDALDELRKKPEMSNYQITTYTHNPLVGVTSITPPSGIRETYIYDSSNRLKQVIDSNGKILKENEYNYKH
ncbi:RHS repeat domain-containing protein [Chryseobacterium wanjuense]|nr:RHS repeat domain-containing protein [Chryseobacterium wanjuense]